MAASMSGQAAPTGHMRHLSAGSTGSTGTGTNHNGDSLTNGASAAHGAPISVSSSSSATASPHAVSSPLDHAYITSDLAAPNPAPAQGPASASVPAAPSPSVNNPVRPLSSNSLRGQASHSPALSSTLGTHANVGFKTAGEGHGQQAVSLSSTPAPRPTGNPSTQASSSPAPRLPPTSGFPSPGRDASHPKFVDDRATISQAIKQASFEATRRSVRDNWEKCLIGSEFHQAFVLNASIHHATAPAIQRGIRDFGKNLIKTAKHQIMDQMSTSDLDQLTTQILQKASVAFFDKAFQRRLETIDAKSLINALARAERLGYEPSDVQENVPSAGQAQGQAQAQPLVNHFHPSPRPAQPAVPAPAFSLAPVAAAAAAAAAAAPQPAPVLDCDICFRRFPAQSAYEHHMKMKVCTRLPSTPGGFKYNCQHCGQGFTTPMGLQYHNMNHVCGDFGQPTTASGINPRKAAANKSPASTLPSNTHVPIPSIPSRPAAAPHTPKPAPPVAPTGGTPHPDDPYAHLSPEQIAALQSELKDAELQMAERMRQAHMLVDAGERKHKLDSLANSFGTRQSLIRKKYGVRLRIRRTRDEITRERARMQYKTSAELQASLGGETKRPGRKAGGSGYAGYVGTPVAAAAAAGGGSGSGSGSGSPAWAAVTQLTATPASTSTNPVPVPTKRRFSGSAHEPATKRMAYDGMKGLGGKAATPSLAQLSGAGTKDEPMALDGSSSSEEDESGSDDSDGTDADEDIPAVLPASVMQALQRSSPAGGSGGSRPGSSHVAAASPLGGTGGRA